jgi:hypothetical protein
MEKIHGFKKQFTSHEDGHEHYKGNVTKMIKIICSVVNK